MQKKKINIVFHSTAKCAKKFNIIREKRKRTNRFTSYYYASRLNYQPLY